MALAMMAAIFSVAISEGKTLREQEPAVSEGKLPEADTASGPRLSFVDGNEISMGSVHKGEKPRKTLALTNDGTDTLHILQVYVDCSCVAASCDKEIIVPGDTASLAVSFNSRGKSPGNFINVVKLKTNAPKRVSRIFVTGRVTD